MGMIELKQNIMRCAWKVGAIATAAALAVGVAPNSGEATAAPANGERTGKAIRDYVRAHPDNYVEINKMLIDAGEKPLEIKFSGLAKPVDAKTAQSIKKTREQEKLTNPQAKSVPADAFGVSGYIVGLQLNDPFTFLYVGEWDFRDDFVNGSDPDDYASIMWQVPSCAYVVSTTFNSYYYDGGRTTGQTMSLEDGGLTTKAPVVKLKDRASGFKLNVDHGHMTTTMNRLACGRNWTGTIGAQFQYEHNQDGGSAIGFSAGWGGLSVTYDGSPSTSKKGTDPSYFSVG